MTTSADIQAELDELTRECNEGNGEQQQLVADIEAAKTRQRLRRLCDEQREELDTLNEDNAELARERFWIDNDQDGEYRYSSDGGYSSLAHPRQAGVRTSASYIKEARSTSTGDRHFFNRSVHREFDWTIHGLSWLVTTLKQQRDTCTHTKAFALLNVDESEEFGLAYNPLGGALHYEDGECADFYDPVVNNAAAPAFVGSLAFTCSSPFVTMRYKFFIRRGGIFGDHHSPLFVNIATHPSTLLAPGGDYEQWGEEQEYVNPTAFLEESNRPAPHFFGPDVLPVVPGVRGGGIFGMSHEQLLDSEWVQHDAMHVKLVLDVRPKRTTYYGGPNGGSTSHLSSGGVKASEEEAEIVIPPTDLGQRLLGIPPPPHPTPAPPPPPRSPPPASILIFSSSPFSIRYAGRVQACGCFVYGEGAEDAGTCSDLERIISCV
jgi:hypothetical protein